MKKEYAWKILKKGMRSNSGNNCKWYKNKWKTHKGELSLCNSGFHASKLLFDAVNYEKTFTLNVEVEAETKDEARDKADKIFSTKMKQELLDMSSEGYFEHTYTDKVDK